MAKKPSLKLVLEKLDQQDEIRKLQVQLLEQQLNEIKETEAVHQKAVTKRLDGFQKTIFHPKTGAWTQITANTRFIAVFSKALWVIIPVLIGSTLMFIFDLISIAKAATGTGP